MTYSRPHETFDTFASPFTAASPPPRLPLAVPPADSLSSSSEVRPRGPEGAEGGSGGRRKSVLLTTEKIQNSKTLVREPPSPPCSVNTQPLNTSALTVGTQRGHRGPCSRRAGSRFPRSSCWHVRPRHTSLCSSHRPCRGALTLRGWRLVLSLSPSRALL
uniref:Uncharacterized protein n=1 Tax=Molossus molossus TaxID=27622 RepID=A0A7J8BYM1_MOLMO|nr:hypothetical protein HJG59_010093 [Molossus molossus]